MDIILSENYNLNPIDYANQGNSIIGIRGSGKTYTATKIAEGLMKAGIPIIVFDPTGVWQNLRYGVGNNKGYPIVVAGGLKPDIDLTPENCTKIIDAALKEKVSLIIDLQGRATSTKTKWLHIVTQSVEFLLEHNQHYGLRHVFIEEAAEFIPQRPNPGGALAYSRLESMARQGRNYGLGYTLINQRAEEIAKAIFEICETVFVHRQNGKNSLKSIDSWLNYKGLDENDIVKSLPKLDNGQCWVIDQAGEQLINILPKETFHPDPKKGNNIAPIKGTADISTFIERMKELIDIKQEPLVKTKNHNSDELLAIQKENTDLKLKNKNLEGENYHLTEHVKLLQNKLSQILTIAGHEKIEIQEFKPQVKEFTIPDRPASVKVTIPGKGSGMHRILNTCAMFYPESVTKSRIGLITNLSPGSGSFNTYLSTLKRDGLIEADGGSLRITEYGLTKVGDIEPLPSGEDLINMWCSHIGSGSGAARILKYLASSYPSERSKSQIGEAVELSSSSGSFNTYLSTLKRNGLITANGTLLKASDELFN